MQSRICNFATHINTRFLKQEYSVKKRLLFHRKLQLLLAHYRIYFSLNIHIKNINKQIIQTWKIIKLMFSDGSSFSIYVLSLVEFIKILYVRISIAC